MRRPRRPACHHSDSDSADSNGLDGQSFVSTAVNGYDVVPDGVIPISFEDGSISINEGCNTMFGGYTSTAT